MALRAADTHVIGSESRSQSVFADLLAEADLDVENPLVVKHAEDQGLMGSVLRAVAHQKSSFLRTRVSVSTHSP